MRRNSDLINYSDAVIIIHDGKSPGTKDSLKKARKKEAEGKLQVYYVNLDTKLSLFI